MLNDDLWFKIYLIISYIPGYFIVRSLQKIGNENSSPGDEVGPGAALSFWVFSPFLVPLTSVLWSWFFIARLMFPERTHRDS